MKKSKILIIFFFGIIIFIYFYLRGYQKMVNDGTALFDDRCFALEANIKKKQETLAKWVNSYNASESAEVLGGYEDEVQALVKENIDFSEPWLEKAKNYINRWDFHFFSDERIEEKIVALLDKYYADYLVNKVTQNYLANPNEESIREIIEVANNMNERQKNLNDKIKAAENYFDRRSNFIDVSFPKCEEPIEDSPVIPLEKAGQTG